MKNSFLKTGRLYTIKHKEQIHGHLAEVRFQFDEPIERFYIGVHADQGDPNTFNPKMHLQKSLVGGLYYCQPTVSFMPGQQSYNGQFGLDVPIEPIELKNGPGGGMWMFGTVPGEEGGGSELPYGGIGEFFIPMTPEWVDLQNQNPEDEMRLSLSVSVIGIARSTPVPLYIVPQPEP